MASSFEKSVKGGTKIKASVRLLLQHAAAHARARVPCAIARD